MHIQCIRFDRVFDIQPWSGNFSFTAGGLTAYGVRLTGRIIPSEGATWSVALGQEGNWSTLLGWRDPENGRIAFMYRVRDVLYDHIDATLLLGVPVLVVSIIFGGPLFALTLLLGWALILGWVVQRLVRRNWRVRAALLAS